MRLEADAGAARWLERLEGRPDDFDWDAGNRAKNLKHEVNPADVEALLAHPILFAGRIVEPVHDEPRWALLGIDASGRHLALIFTRRGIRLRPISCRPMRRNERRMYEEAVHD